MYRYSVDNAVTYTPIDLDLFRESPFAVWMERLTLENPDHGIPPDIDSAPPRDLVQPQDDIVETLRSEGRDVVLIDWDRDEPRRRADTLDAMRRGADFIVNGVLALGPLCGTANMLMRTSGYSELGDFLYVPCDTQGQGPRQSAFRLCFLADLLLSLQGQLPPQLLVIRGDAEVVPLQTDDHIYYYNAVKQRFMEAMESFRKHRMPDPAESAHFGRWSECASEVLKQRAQSAGYQEAEEEAADEFFEEQRELQVAGAAAQGGGPLVQAGPRAESLQTAAGEASAVPTLAEQARMLSPGAFDAREAPGRTPNLALAPVRSAPADRDTRGADDALENLAFIGSSQPAPLYESRERERTLEATDALVDATAVDTAVVGEEAEIPVEVEEAAGESPAARLEPVPAAEPFPEPQTAVEREPEPARAFDAEPAVEGEPEPVRAFDAEPVVEREPEPARAFDAEPVVDPEPDTPPEPEAVLEPVSAADAPAPNLRDTAPPEPIIEGYEVEVLDLESLDLELEAREPFLLPPEERSARIARAGEWGGRDADSDSDAPTETDFSGVDLDGAPPPTLSPVRVPGAGDEGAEEGTDSPVTRGFSSSLITNREPGEDAD